MSVSGRSDGKRQGKGGSKKGQVDVQAQFESVVEEAADGLMDDFAAMEMPDELEFEFQF